MAGGIGGYYMALFVLGFVMLFVGIADLALGIANAVICGMLGSIGYGIWGSMLCFIAAITGIVASQKRSTNSIITHMVFSILAAVSSTIQLAMGTNSAVVDFYRIRSYFYNSANVTSSSQYAFFFDYGCSQTQRDSYNTLGNGPTVTDALLAAFAILQGITAIMAAAFSCRATVCPPGINYMPWQGSRNELPNKA